MTLPNFLVIGAGRSGTTSLHHYLGQHPEIFVSPVKAPSHFYCRDLERIDDPYVRLVVRNYFVPDARSYEALFDGVREEKAIGEVSPVYLASRRVAPGIARELPEVRLIAILRNPVDRAWARFVGRRRDGLEQRAEFGEVVRQELEDPLVRDEAAGTYLASGCVHHFLEPYFELFGPRRIRVHLFEDFVESPLGVVSDLFDFLGVESRFEPDLEQRHNRSGGSIRNPVLRRLWTGSVLWRARLRPHLPVRLRNSVFRLVTRDLVAPRLEPELRAQLTELFRDDTLRLQELLGRDLTHWLEDVSDA